MQISTTAQKSINHIQKRLSETDLRNIFTKRLDDEMFLKVGKLVTQKRKDISDRAFIWLGYELLINMPEPFLALPQPTEIN